MSHSNPLNSAPKLFQNSNEKQSQVNNSVNPFFEYVSNNKLTAVTNIDTKTQTVKIQNIVKKQEQQSLIENINKNNQIKNDPRKSININEKNQNGEVKHQQKQHKQKNQDIRQKRSRSRQNRQNKRQTDDNQKQKKQQHFHKTKLCPLYDKGLCKKGSQCTYAHGEKQLRGLPNFIKTRLCIPFKNGQCKKTSSQCKYAHGEEQLRSLKHGGFEEPPKSERRYRQQKFKRDSQSINHKEKNNRKSISRDNSRDRQKYRHKRDDKRRDSQQNNFYKKKIPINNQYQKYLYGNINTPQFNNSAYLVGNSYPPVYQQSPMKSFESFTGGSFQKLPSASNLPNIDLNINKNQYLSHQPYGYGQIPHYGAKKNFPQQKINYDRPSYIQNQAYPPQAPYIGYGASYSAPRQQKPYQNFLQSDQRNKVNPPYLGDSQKFFVQPTKQFSQPYYYPAQNIHPEGYRPSVTSDKYQPFYGANENQYNPKKIGNQNFLNQNSYTPTPTLYPAFDNGRFPGFQTGGKKNYSNNFSSR